MYYAKIVDMKPFRYYILGNFIQGNSMIGYFTYSDPSYSKYYIADGYNNITVSSYPLG